ncbi:MAG: thioredoxin family protein [Sulfuricurvum sp.]|nr:thioredoxin family protein [Sulfuricurvum sp.]
MMLITTIIFSAPLSLKNTQFYKPNTISIVVFYTSWCPPCTRARVLMNEIKKTHPKILITAVNVDNSPALQKGKTFGLTENIPYILIADQSGTVVKRFQSIPDKTILTALIKRLEEGRLENGTLPANQRIDTWKMNRKGM